MQAKGFFFCQVLDILILITYLKSVKTYPEKCQEYQNALSKLVKEDTIAQKHYI